MICDRCKHEENCPAKAEHGGAKRCSAFKPLTEQEYIQTCNTEQLAEFLFRVWENGYHSTIDIRIPFNFPFGEKWLKQIHKE